MTDNIERRLREDRALRSAARTLVQADFAHLRAELSGRSISSRIFGRIGEAATDVYDEAVEVAENNRGALATLIAALVLWFARNPLIDLFTGRIEEDDDDDPAEH